jgi:hypothetical protein
MTIDSAERTTFQNEIGINRTASSTYKIDIKQDSTEDGIAVRRSSDDAHIASLHTTGGAAVHSMQSSFEAAHTFRISNDSGSTWNNAMAIGNSGAVTMPSQPAFRAYQAVQQTNLPGSYNDISMTGETFDQGGDFNTTTSVFTAPVAGKYLLTAQVSMYSMVNNTWYLCQILGSNTTIQQSLSTDHWNSSSDASQAVSMLTTGLVDMDANDTAYVRIYQYTGGGVMDTQAHSNYTYFSGHLVA